jgi:hypothetical protein
MVTGMTYEESLDLFQNTIFSKPKDYQKELWVGIKEMEKALNFVQAKQIKRYDKCTLPIGKASTRNYRGEPSRKDTKLSDVGKSLFGDYVLFCCQAPGMFLHWIIYLPKKGYVVDPDPNRPDEVHDLDDYKFKRVTRKYFYVLRKEK